MTAISFPSRTNGVKSKVSLKPKRVTPSAYTQEMLQSTEERLASTDNMHQPRILELLDMSNTTHHKFSLVAMDQPLFQPYPSELVFQNFTPAQTYMLPLLLRNIDKVSRHVKLELPESEYFRVVGPEDAGSRVAPGLSATFTVFFTPQENKDYPHRLVCVTERERFVVPIRAIGPRAILDFRDELHLPVCPVKASTERTQLVRNIGNGRAKFMLDTQSPFSVTPSCGTLDEGESMQVTVDFSPMTVGVHSQVLLLHYHTGEDVYISLCGACEELNIRLEPDSVLLSQTYISLASVRKVFLTYSSEISLKYCWTTWPSLQEEALSLLRESTALPQTEEGERERLLVQCESDPAAIHRLPLLSRALQERRSQAVRDYRLTLSHSCITVEPAEGEIWPKTPAQFNIVFKPEEAKLYQQTIYCDVTGREARLPLTIHAEGMGPNLQLNYDLVDMQNVFVGHKTRYEVQVHNRGLIDGRFRLSGLDTTFGRCFSFSPEEGVVPPGAFQTVDVTFHSRVLGTFSEDLLLTVTGRPQPLTVTFSGCVIGPTFHFNVSELNFGDVAFGYPLRLRCSLINTSLVPMTFALRVLGDGLGSPSINSAQQASEVSRNNWGGSAARDLHARPVEFTVTPAAGSVRALSDVTIQVMLCSNTVKRYRLALVVDVEGVGEEILTLPINASCVVPDIVVETPVLDFRRCFLDRRYEQQLRLTNNSTLPACYGMLDQEYQESPSLLFGSSAPRGLILRHSSEELPVFLLAKSVGKQTHTLRIAVFGSSQPPLEVTVSCIGQGPIVRVHSPQLDFGTIPVLTDITRALHLSNQSPIPAHFTAHMSHRSSFVRVEPSEGEVPPESQLELRVVAHLKDTLHFQARLEVSIQDSEPHAVLLSATGTGTTVVSDKPFAPNLDLGTYLSHASCQYHFKLTNQGERTNRMYWRNDGFQPSAETRKRGSLSGRTVLPPISAPRKKGILSCQSSSREKAVFSLSPSRVELAPGGSVDMVLTGSSDSPKVAQERLVCRGFVGRQGCNEVIMSVDVTCRFVAPLLSISSRQLKFYLEKVPGKSLTPLYEKLILENVSSLPLSIELSLGEPFSLCEASGAHSPATTKSMVLGDGRQAKLWVCFNPTYCQDQVSRVVEEALEIHYQGHPRHDTVELYAEVHFPNLHFSTTAVDFGCVLNCTGTRRAISITNCSPLPVSYHWAFLDDQEHGAIGETETLEAEREQTDPANGTKEEGWSSSRMPSSSASSDPLSPRPGADEQNSSRGAVGVEEVFDIFPIYGRLRPGEQQQVIFTFFGHENISREVVAQCRVEEGPTYEITLRGEASVISYSLDSTHIDFGLQLFDHEGEAEVTLRNTGKMGFKFSIIGHQKKDEEAGEEAGGQRKDLEEEQNEEGQDVIPGRPMVIPAMGYIDPGAEQCLHVLYLPGLPEVFEKQLQLQVAFLPPQLITLTGEGVFPRISLNLPQNMSEECYSDVVQQARTAVEGEELMNGTAGVGGDTTEANRTLTHEKLLHMEIERSLVKRNALAVTGSMLELRDLQGSSRKWHKLSQFLLPEYVLDFGYVIPGSVLSHTVNVTNTGSVAVSFLANGKPLAGTGFSADVKRVKNLPCGETQTFTVKFAPQRANLKIGDTSVVMPIQVADGPVVQVRLCAVVTVPAVTVSMDTLQFDTVQCGMCQMKTIQLVNRESVPCCWSIAEKGKPLEKHKKDVQMKRPAPVVFKMIPSSGMLFPGERVNVQITFSPAEGHPYNMQLLVRVAESSQQVLIAAQGQGDEPHLEFCPSVLELGPCMPVATEVEAEVTVKNRCPFPVEFYSLDFDKQYLEEEKILRLIQGYDENNILLLPPRATGESLPTELLEYYQEHCSQLKDDAERKEGLDEEEAVMGDTYEEGERSRQNHAHSADSKVEEVHTLNVKQAELLDSEMTIEGSSGGLGQLEMTPVSRAIARHMRVDLSPEALAARNHKGIAIIVYGAPLTDNGSTAAVLARQYEGACLSVDAVVTEVLVNGTSPVSRTARQLYDCAAAQYAEKKPEEAGQTTEPGPAADLEASEPAPHSARASRDAVEVPSKPSEDGFSGNDSKAPRETENTHLALCLGGDVTSLNNLFPEQLLVDILTERFQLSDCHRGIMVDGLESVYAQSAGSTLQIVLRALNNRKHIFVVNLSDSYAALKAREEAQKEAEEALQKEKADREEQLLQELDEEKYDALSGEEKERIYQRLREKHRQQKLRELEHKAKEEEEKRLQEEMKRLREEELKKKNRKGGKRDSKQLSKKKILLEGKQSADPSNLRRMSSCHNSKESLVDAREQHNSNEVHHSKEADDLQKQTEETKVVLAESPQPSDQLERERSIESAEMKRLREEKELKKSKMGGERDNTEALVKRSPSGRKESTSAPDVGRASFCDNSKKSQLGAKEQHHLNEGASRLHQSKEADHSQKKAEEAKGSKSESPVCIVDELQSQFSAYEQSQGQVEHILQHWDRARGLLLVPFPGEEDAPTEKQTAVVSKKSKRASSKVCSPIPSQMADTVLPRDIIPHIVLNVTGKDSPSAAELLKGSTLPPLVEVLDDLGLGPSGPPIPPPTTFSMVPFPKNREQSDRQLTCSCFTFLVPSGLDEQEDVRVSVVKKEAAATVPKARSKSSMKEVAVTKNKVKKSRESQKSRRQTSAKTKAKDSDRPRSPLLHGASSSDCTEQDQHQENLELKRNQSLTTFRWVVPANGELVLKIWFYSESPGRFEQTFGFELLGTRRLYQLLCRGICTYPSICKDYMTLFAHSKKAAQMEEGLQKTYMIKPECFEFGPLLCGKTRDRYKENRYPENTEQLVIHNNSGLEAEVQFHFLHDSQATTYLLEPPTMTLKPDQKQELTVWAYPTKLGQMNDSVVCQIKDNPELVIINLSCWGVRPELELDSKHFHFKRTLLHRRDTCCVALHNKTALPVSWRLQGVEELGDEFSVPQDQGIIPPNSSFPLCLYFRARRPLHIKKILRLEVSDVEMILGIVNTENLQVTAEAYDINLEIIPADGRVDFGTIKVFENAELSLRMKNQGKYEIAYKFTLPQTDQNLDSIFKVSPMSGTVMPHEKPTTVQILCRPNREVLIREQPLLLCQVIEPSIGNGGQTVGTIDIKVSLKSVFSRYKITPACDLNFGPLVYGCKKSQSFTIENNGDFETCFTIRRMITDPAPPGKAGSPGRKTPQESQSERPASDGSKLKRESVQKDKSVLKNRLTAGVFSVTPCVRSLPPGSQQVVTVDCVAEQLGNCNQGLLIDISDRDPSDQPDGIPYRLLAEVCRPGIASDMSSIFEEHHLCHNSSQLSSEQFCNAERIYVRDENKFIFNKILVGRTAQARFKLTNNSKVPCVLSLAIKYVGAKTGRSAEVFDLSATTLSIPSKSHLFAVVTFTPQAIQLYSAVFEATLEIINRSKVLEFDLMGEGNLPNICVVRPALRNSRGCPMLQFTQVLVGRRHTRPLVLLNDGNVPAQVQIDMLDKHGVFTLKAAPGNTCSSIHSTQIDSERQSVHRAMVRLDVNEQVELEVSFCSDKPLSVEAKMSLQVEDNQYGKTTIQVTGEAYQGIVSLDNIRRSLQEIDQEDEEGGNYEVLNFGDCHVDCPYQESFTMTNHSSSQAVRFEWPPVGSHVFFSPQVGHLHAGCSKEVTVTFSSNQPVTLTSQPIRCKVSQVEFQQPLEQVADWDDGQRTVQWLSSSKQASGAPQQPVKNKVIKTDPEPCCSVVEGSQWEMELRISAVCDYVKFSCNTDTIHFKDTMLYQTRLHQLQIVNHGTVKLEYSWQVLMDPRNNIVNHDQGEGTLTPRPGSRSGAVSTGARPASALASVISLLTGNPELLPISIEPSIGALVPGSTQYFSIRFSPVEVAQFQGRLVSSVPNLQDGDQAPCVSVCGRSLLPHCHFHLEDSDYISGKHRNPDFRGHLDPNTRVIEFNSVDFSVPSTRCFSVVNPTSKPYSFKWRCEDTCGGPFCCLTPCGTILPGKKVEVCFEYVAEQFEAVESFWSFTIEALSLSVPFLCVGTTKEPLVYLDRPHIDFGELLVGRKVEQTVDLVNGEEKLFHFSVLQSSLLSDDQQSSLILQPVTGTVAARDRLPLSVSFTPCRGGYVSFRLALRVKRKSEPLALTVKADCFSMSTSVQLEKPEGGLRDISPNRKDTLDFGKVGISEQSAFNFLVSNLARFRSEVNFDLTGPSELLQHLQTKPQNGTIEVGKQLRSLLFFCPRSICNLRDVRLSIKVKHGPTFTFAIKGRAVAPSLEFSFTKHNFGKCFVYSPGMGPASRTLLISNKGERDISVESQFRNTSYLEMDFQPGILSPGAVMEAPVNFYPREASRYHERLTFVLNSCVTKHVDILGQGIEMKLEVENPKQRKVKLGSLVLGQKVKKQVVLVNRSPLDLSFTLLLNTNTPLDPRDLSFSPAGELNLKASVGSCNVEIQFSPRQHTPPFTAELQAEFAGLLHPLLTIQGCCRGVEVQLDQDHLAFGAVVQRCQARKRIVMMNAGDIGARFQWKTGNFPPELSITPAKGYICPGMEVPFEVTFSPVELINDKRYENLSCCVEGSPSPVTLTVTGSCIVASTSKEMVNFVCPVRGSHSQTLPVFNPTNQHCSIRPVVEGEQWSAASSVILEPLQNKTYKITYRPLSITADGKKHLGSVFFSFPDGTGMLYSLQGTAEPPKAEDNIVHELPAKTHHTEMLPVHNWLSKQQRFRVLMEILKPDKPDATVSLKGLEYIEVSALARRDYKMSFFTYREGHYNTKVTFHNEGSGEYLYYLVTFKATSPGVLSTIELVTPVRQTASATVQVENPLTTVTCLTTECKCPEISAPLLHTVPGQSKGSLSFEYQPLRAGESTARLTLHSNDLGYFHYNLLLTALPPPPEKTVHFNTCLGSSHSVLVKFTNHARFKTEYSGKTDCPEFTVDKALPQVGSEVSMEVSFEPHQLGKVRGQLSVSSVIGGYYIFPLHGISLPPKAQGPFSVRTGHRVAIPFKNIFLQTTTFSFQVDNNCFTVKEADPILSKKTHNILISFEAPPEGFPGPWFGKLTVSSQCSEGHSRPCSWVYYLKGLPL
ncbi:hydrocephalus-inducing protein homolog isoform X1 [Anarrhichthys ocellatus]|uniref:hydrocephalus-inducing protein homolog isoform X1 n=1 Tax=Anarrhichthys ocellatus TaxID=433405 RepID=UPI0012ED1E38|nr:hydrocephalus-inducing protein homolog isoform X1 [Anarrhichthys ocellatus]XP_031731519.1 hydrocephalus-inducing protein homolog isoform X1 [Anarrhichthys ocellatus]